MEIAIDSHEGLASAKVLGVLAGADMPLEQLAAWAKSADLIVAADGAADRLILAGMPPHITIGDLDSLSEEAQNYLTDVRKDVDQETTDADKLLALVEALGHRSVTLIGSEGDLPDHQLAVYHSALACDLSVRFVFRRGIGFLVRAEDSLTVDCLVGSRVSLLPLAPADGVSLKGVEWELLNAPLALGARVSISNVAAGVGVSVSVGSGAALLFVETGEINWEA